MVRFRIASISFPLCLTPSELLDCSIGPLPSRDMYRNHATALLALLISLGIVNYNRGFIALGVYTTTKGYALAKEAISSCKHWTTTDQGVLSAPELICAADVFGRLAGGAASFAAGIKADQAARAVYRAISQD